MKPLNVRQETALKFVSKTWAQAPRGVHIATLMSLIDRGLVECRPVKGLPTFKMSYTSAAWEWRRTSPHNDG